MYFLSLVTIASLLTLATAIEAQDPIFHASQITANRFKHNCKYTLDLDVKANADALYDKMIEKKVKRVWVSNKTQAVIRKDGKLHIKYNGDFEQLLRYICGSKPYHIEEDEYKDKSKEPSSKKLVSTKSIKAEDAETVKKDTEEETLEHGEISKEEKKKKSKKSTEIEGTENVEGDTKEKTDEEIVENEEKEKSNKSAKKEIATSKKSSSKKQ